MINESDYVDLGLACADVCQTLERGMEGSPADALSPLAFQAVTHLTKWVQPVIDIVDGPFTTLPIAGLSRRSRRISPTVDGGGMYLPM